MTEKPSSARISIKWGVLIGLVLMLCNSILYTASLSTKTGFGFLPLMIVIVGLSIAMRDFRAQNGGFISFGEGMSIGALTSAIFGLLSSTYNVFYMTVIDPTLMANILEQTRDQMEEQGKATDEQIDQAMEMMKVMQSPGLQIISGMFFWVIFGVLLSLIIAAVVRRKNNNPFD